MRQVLLYDPKRVPADWTELIQPGECCVFLSDAENATPIGVDGVPVASASRNFCLLFPSLSEAEAYCKTAVEKIPRMRCEVFDFVGRTKPPVRVFVDPEFAHTMDSEAGALRLFRFGFLALGTSLPLFWWGWKSTADGSWLWVVLGINAVVVGLRLIYWAHGVREQLRNAGKEASVGQRVASQGGR